MTSNENNLTPGEMLIAAREKASLSLEEVAEKTRIAANMLRAIELDEYHKVSGDLYVKSFLRSYADAVELDPEELINLYLIYTGAASTEGDGSQPAGWDEQDVKITKVGLPWFRIAMVVLAIAGGSFLYYWVSGLMSPDPVAEKIESPMETAEQQPPSTVFQDSVTIVSTTGDTLALGWQMEKNDEKAVEDVEPGPPPGSGKLHLPEALDGSPQMSFAEGHQWSYVVRLISEESGDFAVKRDAESAFQTADFPPNLAEAKPLPGENVVEGRAYAVRRGFVVYWGADDHLSLRLGHVRGVEVSFNGVVQNVSRFRDGEEILLDSSRLAEPLGN